MALPSQWFLKKRGLATGASPLLVRLLFCLAHTDAAAYVRPIRHRRLGLRLLRSDQYPPRPPLDRPTRISPHPARLHVHPLGLLDRSLLSSRGEDASTTEGRGVSEGRDDEDGETLAAKSECDTPE